MITYKDMCWCSQSCGNKECFRNYTDQERERNINSVDLPLTLSNMKTDKCGYTVPLGTNND